MEPLNGTDEGAAINYREGCALGVQNKGGGGFKSSFTPPEKGWVGKTSFSQAEKGGGGGTNSYEVVLTWDTRVLSMWPLPPPRN